MQVFTCTQGFKSQTEGREFKPGDKALYENNNTKAEDAKVPQIPGILKQYGTLEEFSMLQFGPMLDWNKLQPGDKVLVHRVGGVGDIVQSGPICQEIRRRGGEVVYCLEERMDAALPILGAYDDETHFTIRRRKDYFTVPLEVDWVVSFESCIEVSVDPDKRMLDLYLERTKNPPAELLDIANMMPGGIYFEKAQEYIVNYLQSDSVAAKLEDMPDYIPPAFDVLLAPYASATTRSANFVERIREPFLQKHVVGSVGVQRPIFASNICVMPHLPIEHLYSIIYNSGLIVTSDNGISHIAYWMNKDMVAAYSVVKWTARMYPREGLCIIDFSDLCHQAPCWWHNSFCPIFQSAGEQVMGCAALLQTNIDDFESLLESRLVKKGKRPEFKLMCGTDMLGKPQILESMKGIRNPDGSLYYPHV